MNARALSQLLYALIALFATTLVVGQDTIDPSSAETIVEVQGLLAGYGLDPGTCRWDDGQQDHPSHPPVPGTGGIVGRWTNRPGAGGVIASRYGETDTAVDGATGGTGRAHRPLPRRVTGDHLAGLYISLTDRSGRALSGKTRERAQSEAR